MAFFDYLLGADAEYQHWPRVEPSQITKPVPAWLQPPGPIGAADKAQNTFGAPLPPECAIEESGRVVGYRTACGGK